MATERTAAQKRAAGRKPGQVNKCSNKTISKDIRLQTLTALNFVGGVKFLVAQAKKKNNAPFMALLGKCLQQDDGSTDASVTFVIQTLNLAPQPTSGVLNSPIEGHIAKPLRLVANGEVIDVEPAPGAPSNG
jgi:hypothetical protein